MTTLALVRQARDLHTRSLNTTKALQAPRRPSRARNRKARGKVARGLSRALWALLGVTIVALVLALRLVGMSLVGLSHAIAYTYRTRKR